MDECIQTFNRCESWALINTVCSVIIAKFVPVPHVNRLDHRILGALQVDSSLSTIELSEAVGLSQSPCWRRLQRLHDEGYIRSKVALLDRIKLGLNVQFFALIN